MKHILYILLILITFAGCDTININVEAPVLEVFRINPKTQNIDYKGGTFAVELTSFKPWHAEADSSWIRISPSSSESSCEVSVTIEGHHNRNGRSGSAYFINDSDTLELNIKQSEAPYIEVADREITIDGDGGIIDALFLSNTSVHITSNVDWIRIINISTGNILSFEVLRNSSDAREGCITISASTDSEIFKTITVCQGEKVPHPELSFEEGNVLYVTEERDFTLHPIFVDMIDYQLLWSASNNQIASVDYTGNISIHSTGICSITAFNAYHNVSATVNLDIKLRVEHTSVMFGDQDMMNTPISSRFVGEMVPITLSVTPSYAYSDDFVLFSSNQNVAELDNNILHCKKVGKTEIHIESSFNNFKYTFTVLVIEQPN